MQIHHLFANIHNYLGYSFVMMMNFCKKSVHSFLGAQPINFITNIEEKPSSCINGNNNHSTSIIQSGGGGLGLMSATRDICNLPNVLESSTIKSSPSSQSQSTFSFLSASASSCSSCSSDDGNFLGKKDLGGIGFINDTGGLMSCTESLGCESSNERGVDDVEIEQLCLGEGLATTPRSSKMEARWRRSGGERREAKKYPPPIPSLNQNGQPSFYFKSVRKNGRLELTEVRIERPKMLRASRQDGRLRLHLVRNEEEEEEEEEEEIEEEVEQEQENVEKSHAEEKNGGQEWSFLEGFRRTQEEQHDHNHSNQHQHKLHVWRQQCVTTR